MSKHFPAMFAWLRRLVLGGAVVGTLIAAFYVIENWRGRRAYAAFASAAQAAGISLQIRDHAPRPVPDAENFAKTPLFDAPLTDDANARHWQPLADRLTLRRANSSEYVAATLFNVPFHRFAHWGLVRRSDFSSVQRESDGVDLAAELARLAPELAEIARAAERPFARYQAELEKTYGMKLWHLGCLRRAVTLFGIRGALAIEQGDAATAARDVHTLLRLVYLDRDQPMLVSQMIRMFPLEHALAIIWEGTMRNLWTEADLARFAADLAPLDFLRSARAAFAAECAAISTVILGVIDNTDEQEKLLRLAGIPRTVSRIARHTLKRPLLGFIPRGWWLQNLAVAGRVYLDQRIAPFDLNARRIHTELADSTVIEATLSKHFSGFTTLARIAYPGFSPQIGHAQNLIDLARLAVGLERHRLKHGAFPEKIDGLATSDPELLALRDVIDGGAYHYRREPDGGFRVWSNGWDHRDDGGTPGPAQGSSVDVLKGDWVWVRPK
jgi:hypothetical protein